MSGTDVLYVGLIILCLFLSAFFSISETAFISLQRIRLEHMANNGVKGAKLVASMLRQPEKLLSTILLGNNFINTAAAALGTTLAIKYWPEQGIFIATIGITIILLIFCEVTPKTLGIRHAERLSFIFAQPIRLISWVFTPFVFILSWIASGVTKLVGGTPIPRSLVGEEEIRTMISVGYREGTVEEEAAEMLHNVFECSDRPVREVMVPRPKILFIKMGSSLTDFLELYTQHPLNRYPVYKESQDDLVGVLSIKDVFMEQAKGTINGESTIDHFVRPVHLVSETKPVNELLAEMRDGHFHMCIVVDKFDNTAGIVSLGQLVGEIIGPAEDEMAGAEKEHIDKETKETDATSTD